MVNARAMIVFCRVPAIKLWCAQVTVTPEDNRIAVFNKGTEKGLITEIPVGGQTQPISWVGARLA